MKNTLKLKTFDIKEDIADITTAAEILKNGGIVAIPTETVYGLAADAFNPIAVSKIFAAKGRPQDNPLIVHISSFSQIYSLASEVPESAKSLAEKFWPGPLTMILPKKEDVPFTTSGGLDTIAVRMPSNPVTRKIIELSCPLAAPSANISGFPSPTAFEHVLSDMDGRADAICDGGQCSVGVESTVVSLVGETPVVLRPGGITPDQLRSVLGEVQISYAVLNPMKDDERVESPGMKYKHYSPSARLTIVDGSFDFFVQTANDSCYDGIMCFEGEEYRFPHKKVVTFGRKDEPLTQTRRLFDALRELDEKGAGNVLVRNPSDKDVGLAVCNRLYRAAAFRFIREKKGKLVGLTGPTGAGKGYVGEYLAGLGCYICDTDEISHEITEKNSPFLNILSSNFGQDIINDDGSLNRSLLAERAFKTKEDQEKLNSLTHPEILKISFERCEKALAAGSKAAVIDAPLLFESGADKKCDIVISVICPREIRCKRIMERDNITEGQAEQRMSVQHDDKFYTERSDYVVRSYPPFSVESELSDFRKKYLSEG